MAHAAQVSASLRTLSQRAQPIAKAFIAHLAKNGLRVTLTSTRRDMKLQRRLYQNFQRCGCSDCGKRPGQAGCVPAAAPGKSTHGQGMAFDLHIVPEWGYRAAGELWESMGFTWGGRFDDPIHFDFRRR